MGFLDNLFKNDKSNNNINNPFGGQRSFHGTGQSLGGSKPGTVIPIVLPQPGPLGVRVEKRKNSSSATAIVHEVVPNGQAEQAGMQRGDILCFAGSNGQEEIMYDMFLEMAKASTQRPIHLEVRRISTSTDKQNKTAATSNATATATSNFSSSSADAESRRKAVIAAAEAREKAHKIKSKPMKQVTKTTLANEKKKKLQQEQQVEAPPLSEASKQAAQAAKQGEAQVAKQLGYNPYETSRATAGQARNATTAVQHGTITSNTDNTTTTIIDNTMDNTTTTIDNDATTTTTMEPSQEFQQAFATIVSSTSSSASNNHNHDDDSVNSSLTIMKKLLINATTKGQQQQDDDDDDASFAKFRKVRLANPKIKAAIVDVHGAIDLMMACGFTLQEQDGESVLLYPSNFRGPDWLPTALQEMENNSM